MLPDAVAAADLGRVGILGAGAVGVSLGRALAARGARVVAVASRSEGAARALAAMLPAASVTDADGLIAQADLIFLAVPDDALSEVARRLPWRPGQRVVHLSGARGADALASAQARGAAVAALHPLMTFPRALALAPLEQVLARLAGCTWALETPDPAFAETLSALVALLGGRLLRLGAADRVAYHLAAVLVSNDVVSLVGAATEVWSTFGVSRAEALQAVLPLLRATVASLDEVGLPGALTGAVARGDTSTLAAHLGWLRAGGATLPEGEALLQAYRALALLALPLATAKGLPPQAAAAIQALLAATRDEA